MSLCSAFSARSGCVSLPSGRLGQYSDAMEVDVKGAAHCSFGRCHQLDFLPFKCDACKQVFCQEHFSYTSHNCVKADQNSVQVILCPMCEAAVRLRADEDPNVTWDRHFRQSCTRSLPSKTGPPRCPVPGCKEKLGPSNKFECKDCRQTVCLRHRFPEEHDCKTAFVRQKPHTRETPFSAFGAASAASSSAPAQAPAPPSTGKKKKKSLGQRIGAVFACFKGDSAKKSLLGSQSSQR